MDGEWNCGQFGSIEVFVLEIYSLLKRLVFVPLLAIEISASWASFAQRSRGAKYLIDEEISQFGKLVLQGVHQPRRLCHSNPSSE
jgi:hypothetical protein